jgi:hypothetical protein
MRISLNSLRQRSKENRPASQQEVSQPGRAPVSGEPLSEILDGSSPDLLAQKLLQALRTNPALADQLVVMLGLSAAAPREPDDIEGPVYQATSQGNGAVAQGNGAQAAGAGGVVAGGSMNGPVLTGHNSRVIHTGGGTYVEGGVATGGGDFVGRDQTVQE